LDITLISFGKLTVLVWGNVLALGSSVLDAMARVFSPTISRQLERILAIYYQTMVLGRALTFKEDGLDELALKIASLTDLLEIRSVIDMGHGSVRNVKISQGDGAGSVASLPCGSRCGFDIAFVEAILPSWDGHELGPITWGHERPDSGDSGRGGLLMLALI
jgi:hypothetical protein